MNPYESNNFEYINEALYGIYPTSFNGIIARDKFDMKAALENIEYLCVEIILTVLVKIDASDIVMINHVLHDYAERVSNAARHHSMRLCWYTTSWVHDAVMYD